jgi:type III secretory pathway component EscT
MVGAFLWFCDAFDQESLIGEALMGFCLSWYFWIVED